MGKKKKYITKDEIELLSKLSPEFATGSEESKRLYDLNNPYFVVDERENNLEINWETGNEQGYLSMVLLTLYSWDAGKQPLISKTQRIYMVPKDKASDPKTYLSNNMVRYEINSEDVVSVCINRFGSAINKKAIGDTIASIASRDTPLSFDPYRALVKLYMKQVKADETKRVEFEDFKSKFTQLGEKAPYTDFALKLLLIQPWAVAEHKQTPQHMPIFKSEQGVGKSTIINRLGLSWADEIKTLVGKSNSEKLEIANKRELNAVLEFAEMSRFTTTSIEENKSAVTVREEQMLLKFSNLLTKFTYRALIIGSTNSEAFLKDNTGERRYLPLEIESFSRDLTYDFVGRAIATAIIDNDKRVENGEDEDKVWNIYHEETEEDLDFKRANFGLQDTAILGVQKWLKQMVESRIEHGVARLGFWYDENGDMPVPATLEDNPVVGVDLEKKKLIIQGVNKTINLWLTQKYYILGTNKEPSAFPVSNFTNRYKVTKKRYLVGDLRTWFLEVPFKALPDITKEKWEKLAMVASLDVIRETKPDFSKSVDPDMPF